MPEATQQYFDAAPESVRKARDFTASTLESWGLDGPVEDIRLCVSELASNAVVHGTEADGGFLVRLDTEDDFVRLEVHDSRSQRPEPHAATAADITGRGLLIIEMLADGWGVEDRTPHGKIVWTRFTTITQAPRRPADHASGRAGT
jgi:anti-sigma regulatory factor (Ser/Thr protein kinase)